MKKLLILGTIITTAFLTSCKKEEADIYIDCDFLSVEVPASEIDSLKSYIMTNEIMANYDERGFYFIIEKAGEELHPDRCYTVSVDYKTYNFNGVYVDDGTKSILRMHQLINGFQLGTNKIGKEGKIKVYLPPSLAYGARGSSPAVGANEYLIFEISLNSLTYNNLK